MAPLDLQLAGAGRLGGLNIKIHTGSGLPDASVRKSQRRTDAKANKKVAFAASASLPLFENDNVDAPRWRPLGRCAGDAPERACSSGG